MLVTKPFGQKLCLQILERQLHQAGHPGDSSATRCICDLIPSQNPRPLKISLQCADTVLPSNYSFGNSGPFWPFGILASGPDHGAESVIWRTENAEGSAVSWSLPDAKSKSLNIPVP